MWLSHSLVNFQNIAELSRHRHMSRFLIDNKTEETWHDQQEDKDKAETETETEIVTETETERAI